MVDKFREAGSEIFTPEESKFVDDFNDDFEESYRDDEFTESLDDADREHHENSGMTKGDGLGEAGDQDYLNSWIVQWPKEDKFSTPWKSEATIDNSALETYNFGHMGYIPVLLMDNNGNPVRPETLKKSDNKFGD